MKSPLYDLMDLLEGITDKVTTKELIEGRENETRRKKRKKRI